MDNESPPQVVAESPGVRNSGLATATLVLGVLGMFSCGFMTVPALICGIIAINKINKSHGSIKGRRRAIVGLVLGGAGPFLGIVLMRAPTTNPEFGRRAQCISNLKALGIAIAGFAQEHDGKLPEKLEDMSEYYGSDRILFCPSAKDKTHYSYVLTGATNVWGVSSNTIILIEIDPNHYGRRHVLFDDGRVELKASSEL